jgi:hypothetical protein
VSVGRIHRRDPRGDWSLEVTYPDRYYSTVMSSVFIVAPAPSYRVDMRLTRDQMDALYESSRGAGVTFSYHASYGDCISARGIEVTAEEADQIAHGTHPLDVLFDGPWRGLGYSLKVVPAPLT